jgi:dTDP-4-dehydrorhamnose reductase
MKAMVVGSSGMLGSAVLSLLGGRGVGVDLPEFDVTDTDFVYSTVKAVRPDVILNTSAVTDVDYCERNPESAEEVHHLGVRNLASTGVRLITVSTDHVFSGSAGGRYLFESDPVNPVNAYAASKLRGEGVALEHPGNSVVRTSWLFGEKGLLPWIANRLFNTGVVTAVTDQTSCVTSVGSLAGILVDMASSEDRTGLFHCVNRGAVTPFELACMVRGRIGRGTVKATTWKQLDLPAPRPVWSALGTHRELKLPLLEEVLEQWLQKML